MIEAEFGRYQAAYDKVARAARTEPAAAAGADRPARTAGPAVVLSLSPVAEAALRGKSDAAAAAGTAARSTFDRIEPSIAPKTVKISDDYLKASERYFELVSQNLAELSAYSPAIGAKNNLSENEKNYNQLLNIKPVPAVELEGQEKKFALEIASRKGYSIGGADTLSFGHEGFIYTIHKDGTVTKNDGNIPTSEKFKQDILEFLKTQIDLGQTDLTAYEERSAARATEIAELSAFIKKNDPRRP